MKYVYLLKAGENHYKVGVSVNVTKRVRGIQTSNGNKVYVIATKLCEHAELVERSLHKKLQAMGTRGGTEWFALEPEDVIRIAILMNLEPEVDVYQNTDLNKQLVEQNLRHKRLENKLDKILNISQSYKPRAQHQENYDIRFHEKPSNDEIKTQAENELLIQAASVVRLQNKASTSLLQRRLRIGYGRAARILEELEKQGIVGPADGSRARVVYLTEAVQSAQHILEAS